MGLSWQRFSESLAQGSVKSATTIMENRRGLALTTRLTLFFEAVTAIATTLGGLGASLRGANYERRLSEVEDALVRQRFILLLLTSANLGVLIYLVGDF